MFRISYRRKVPTKNLKYKIIDQNENLQANKSGRKKNTYIWYKKKDWDLISGIKNHFQWG